ncbi:MAG: aminopeptidase N [Desulfobulbaceae bacterium]|nr:aminopeptidase N [Desulfobulbaceae bacterium]
MFSQEHKVIYLKDYSEPAFYVDKVDLRFELHEHETKVISTLWCRRNSSKYDADEVLALQGENMQLLSLRLDGQTLSSDSYTYADGELRVENVPAAFELQSEIIIDPLNNTALEGLYLSNGNFCTQCEPEGFRRITFFPDRPDVMALFTTTIVGDKTKYPVLLSNGNPVARGDLDNNRHYVTWRDPFKKPCYLFALVAGDLVQISDSFTTVSGREVALHIYVEQRNKDKCSHAMQSLIKSMKWDEQVFGREYDLDIYMIVAVDDFNMGAMENKGLNVFNSKYVLALPETATDQDYEGIEGVIGHEYFHNWTGNRITCRDWFQLSLKEGLTVFRDQEFSSDMASRAVKRINEVRVIRDFQFREDSGPMAHPVRPASYMEINNFYTLTVYNKGAEVIRMMHTLMGPEKFRAGMDLYFDRHDSQAVTCDDFVQAMVDGGGFDAEVFKRWYSQAGTPTLIACGNYDAETQCYTLELSQVNEPSPGCSKKEPFHIPVALGLLDKQGNDIALQLRGADGKATSTKLVNLKEQRSTYVFEGVKERPVLSLLRDFSAPVKVKAELCQEDLAFLMAHDTDPFNRWSAGQELAVKYLLERIGSYGLGEATEAVPGLFVEAFEALLADDSDPALVALAMELPGENWLNQQVKEIDPEAIFQVRNMFRYGLAEHCRESLLAVYEKNVVPGPYRYHADDAGKRSLRNTCLSYLLASGAENKVNSDMLEKGERHYLESNNMTDKLAALRAVVNCDRAKGDELLDDFHGKWHHDPLVMDKWLTLQAICTLPGSLDKVRELMKHESFSVTNPNKIRALIGAFCTANQAQFHHQSGEGYSFLADFVIELDDRNPQIASRLLTPFTTWRRYDLGRQDLMRGQLEKIGAKKKLSRDVDEVISKCLVS